MIVVSIFFLCRIIFEILYHILDFEDALILTSTSISRYVRVDQIINIMKTIKTNKKLADLRCLSQQKTFKFFHVDVVFATERRQVIKQRARDVIAAAG